MKKIDNDTREKVIALREQGLTLTEIADAVGHISSSWVGYVCADAGLTGQWIKHKRNEQMREYKAQGHTCKEVAEHFGISYKRAQKICVGTAPQIRPHDNQNTKHTEEEKRAYVESFMGDAFSYVGGYIDCEHKVTVRCNKCGDVFERSMVSIRHRKATCKNCERIESEVKAKEKAEAEARAKAIAKAERHELTKQRQAKRRADKEAERLLKTRLIQCEECGKVFATTRTDRVCCSPECLRKRSNRMSSHRKDSRIKPSKRVDRDITAKKLYNRDGGVCWICGGLCDLTDYVVKDGTIICGENYPSVDHVVAICDGGEDSWENVRLAHRYCNSARYWGGNQSPRLRPFTLPTETPMRVGFEKSCPPSN